MSVKHPIENLPVELTLPEAVEAVYGPDLDWVEDKLRQKMSVLVECDMQLVVHLCMLLRPRLKKTGRGGTFRCRFVSGARQEGSQQGSMMMAMARELADHVRSAEPGTVIIVPHLDLLTTTTRSGLSDTAREVIALCYENPEAVILGFKDPSLELPKVVENVFAGKRSMVGIPRDRLPRVILRREAKKFGCDSFEPFTLYKYVSGLNAVRFRQIMEHIQDRLDFDPQNPGALRAIYRDIRELTLGGELEVPRVDLETDIGGYDKVKERIEKDILSLYLRKSELETEAEVKAIEELIPKGIIFEGPPGTGKTYFAKAIATALDATAIVVSGPELKSKWVGESEQNLRQIFTRARQSAPAIIIFDELDSFAVRRGMVTGSGVEHSMVNQLLTEMDGFRKEELVFVIGTTNFVEALDGALLRPGRFELSIKIPYPNEKDRRSILEVYQKKFKLTIPEKVFSHIVRKTGGYSNVERRTKFSGDHLYAICRALAREQVRKGKHESTKKEVDEIIGDTFAIRPPNSDEEKTIAVHESGHALTAALLEHASPPEKISMEGMEDSPVGGFVMQERRRGDHVITRNELIDEIGVLMGGRAAEQLILEDISAGAENDLMRATAIAREMVERWGMSEDFSSMVFIGPNPNERGQIIRRRVADSTEQRLDQAVEAILKHNEARVEVLLKENRPLLEEMIAEVEKERVLEKETILKFANKHGITLNFNEDDLDDADSGAKSADKNGDKNGDKGEEADSEAESSDSKAVEAGARDKT